MNEKLPGTYVLEFKINFQQDSRLVRQRLYCYSQEARVEIEWQIQELLAIKFIRYFVLLWASNVLLVKNKNREMLFLRRLS